ncbi:MAG: kelch repeat-containing protein [Bacteriovorax sp.]|nr:kelch repeat-containing protein [Bacteriovorax sp.]
MKTTLLATIMFFSQAIHADMLFMRESGDSKQIMWQKLNNEVVPLTTGSKVHLYPDISSNGQKAIYVEGQLNDQGANLELVLHDLKTNQSIVWTTDLKGMILHPKFSKNGKVVFFSAPSTVAGKNVLYFAETELLNFAPKVLNETEIEEAYFPRPSSDASFVVYQKNSPGKKEIIFFDRVGNEKTVIAEGMSPALSFDERFIAYTSKKDGNWNIYLFDRFLKTTKQLTNDAGDEMAPTFMPDNHIVFASNKSGHFQLFKIENNNTWTSIAHSENADDYAPQFSGETQYQQSFLPNFPGPQRSSFGTIIHNGKLYMAGGHAGPEHTYPKESFTNDFDVYDIATKTWTTLAPRLNKAHGFQLAALGNYIYAFGGFTFAEEYNPQWKSLDVIERYNIEKNIWEFAGHLTSPRSSNVAITIGTKVYIIGGWDSTPKKSGDFEGTFQSSIDVFDLETEALTVAPFELPKPLRRAFTGLNYNGKILLVGGLGVGSSHFELISNLTLIDPSTGVTKELPPLPFATFAPAAEIIGKELFVFGGMYKFAEMNYDYVAHIYALNLPTKKWRHTGRYLKETKGFSQVFKLNQSTIGILGGHHYFNDEDSPVSTFETFAK